jgi:hypothetical protein
MLPTIFEIKSLTTHYTSVGNVQYALSDENKLPLC